MGRWRGCWKSARLRLDAVPCRPGIAFRSVRASCPDSRAKHPCFACRDPRPPGHGSLDWRCDAPVGRVLRHASDWRKSSRGGGCGEQRMDALRRRVSHGWLTEPRSNPRLGTTPAGGLIHSLAPSRAFHRGKKQKKAPAGPGLGARRIDEGDHGPAWMDPAAASKFLPPRSMRFTILSR